MRPVMGAPDDTPQIHGMCDEIEALREKLRERDDLIVTLQHQALQLRHDANGWKAKYINEKILRNREAGR